MNEPTTSISAKKPTPIVGQLWQFRDKTPGMIVKFQTAHHTVPAAYIEGMGWVDLSYLTSTTITTSDDWKCVGYQLPDSRRVLVGEKRRSPSIGVMVDVIGIADNKQVFCRRSDDTTVVYTVVYTAGYIIDWPIVDKYIDSCATVHGAPPPPNAAAPAAQVTSALKPVPGLITTCRQTATGSQGRQRPLSSACTRTAT